jgi:hypothetical protein
MCQDPAGCAVVSTLAALGAAWGTGWAYDHRLEIAASWADGVEQVAVWRAALAVYGPVLAAAPMWLLALLAPGHGAHRRPPLLTFKTISGGTRS